MTRRQPPRRNQFAAYRPLQTRWMDNDEYGHLNNATYLSLVDTAVSLWQMHNGICIRGPDAMRFLVVETRVFYFAEIGFPDRIDAGIALAQLGSSSVTLRVGLFLGDDDPAAAEAFFAQVLTGADGRPTPIPAGPRRLYESLPCPA